jgi:hypothetical protein
MVLDIVDCDVLVVKPRVFQTSIGLEVSPAVPIPPL